MNKERRAHMIGTWLNDAELALLDQLCASQHRTRSEMLRWLISQASPTITTDHA